MYHRILAQFLLFVSSSFIRDTFRGQASLLTIWNYGTCMIRVWNEQTYLQHKENQTAVLVVGGLTRFDRSQRATP